MKFKLTASASSNITYNRKEIYDDGMDQEDWNDMSEAEQIEYLDELATNFVWDDIDCGAEPIEE